MRISDWSSDVCSSDLSFRDVGATLSSGGFATAGMVVVPCSMRTLAAVAHGLSDNLITRAADVTLKERRRRVMMVRETPLNLAHLSNMTRWEEHTAELQAKMRH